MTGTTFGIFMAEAFIHDDMGQANSNGQFRLRLPPPRELAKIAAVIGASSLASGLLIGASARRTGRKA